MYTYFLIIGVALLTCFIVYKIGFKTGYNNIPKASFAEYMTDAQKSELATVEYELTLAEKNLLLAKQKLNHKWQLEDYERNRVFKLQDDERHRQIGLGMCD